MAEVEKIFFLFDLETNGLPYLSSMDYKFINNWPNTVQISWGLYNEKGKITGLFVGNDFSTIELYSGTDLIL